MKQKDVLLSNTSFFYAVGRGYPGTVDQTVPGLCEKRDKKMKRRD
jgi:hypothetical protein